MKAAGFVAVALGGCALGVIGSAGAQAQSQAQPAAAQGQANPARAPSRTPLGRLPAEVLASKVVVSDMQNAFDFYTKVIGLRPAKSVNQKEPIPPAGADNSKWPVEYGFNFSGSYAEAFFDILRPRADNMPTPASTSLVQLVFKVPDAPAVIRRAKALGYTVTREAAVVGPGEMSIGMLSDPDGYRVEIIQAASYPADTVTASGVPAAAPAAKAMTLMASSVPCSDFERSLKFYVAGLGMTNAQGAGPNEMALIFPGGGATLLLQKPREGASPLPVRTGLSRVTLEVPDLKALADRLAAAGFPLQGRITEMAQYHVSIAQTQDPDGNAVELVQRGP
jgi:lactoylglutathione lyase